MSKCGKGCLPECEYFTTGGCISPFNCAYKIKEHYQNTVFTSGDINALSGIEKFFINTVKSGVLPQEPMNYDGAAMKAYISYLESENAALRERLDKTEKEIDEYKRKIKYGKLVEPVWFISFLNGLPCYGRVIGYQEDSGFVMQCSDCMISAKKIYLSEEEAEKERKKESKY